MRNTLLKLPKTDIHCHLDGSLRPQTVLELGKKYGVKLPADNLKDLTPHVQVAPTCRSLKEFLDVFHVLYPLLQHSEAVERIAYELVEDCAAENTRHVDVRFAPSLQAHDKFRTDAVVEATLKGLKRGFKDFGTSSSVIICLFRSHGPKENRWAFESLKKYFKNDSTLEEPAVVGVDLAGDEARYPTIDYADFYREAKKLGIWMTCHAGETKGTANLEAALQLDVHRIGHGTHLLEDARLMAEVVKRKVPLEIGISSNIRTKSVSDFESHPAPKFYKAGVEITLNTDDRGILGIDLTHEYQEALRLGFSLEQLAALSRRSVEHLFLPESQKARLRKRFDGEIAELLTKAGGHR